MPLERSDHLSKRERHQHDVRQRRPQRLVADVEAIVVVVAVVMVVVVVVIVVVVNVVFFFFFVYFLFFFFFFFFSSFPGVGAGGTFGDSLADTNVDAVDF